MPPETVLPADPVDPSGLDPAPVKRPRGRPRKPVDPTKVKRPVGRPRKSPLPEPNTVPGLALVDEFAIAKAIHMSVSWVRKDRIGARLLPFVALGPSVRYSVPDVLQAVKGMTRGGFGKRKS